ncbi:hypothetical protein GCM10025762_28400 [Haloechinothrix salitolerans]
MLTVVLHDGAAALFDLDQPGVRHPLDRLTYGGPGDAEYLGEPAFAWQRLTRGEFAVDHVGEKLIEDLIGDRPAVYTS